MSTVKLAEKLQNKYAEEFKSPFEPLPVRDPVEPDRMPAPPVSPERMTEFNLQVLKGIHHIALDHGLLKPEFTPKVEQKFIDGQLTKQQIIKILKDNLANKRAGIKTLLEAIASWEAVK